jgi:hypothetical protein
MVRRDFWNWESRNQKKKMWISALAISALAVFQGAAAQSAARATTTYLNSIKFMFDTDGNQIDAYAAKIQRMYFVVVNSLSTLTICRI